MAVTYTGTLLGTYRSIIRNSLVSTGGAAAGSETVTFAHNLGACPTEIRTILRSATVIGGVTGTQQGPVVSALNASIATLLFFSGGGAGSAYYDFIAEVTHSIVS